MGGGVRQTDEISVGEYRMGLRDIGSVAENLMGMEHVWTEPE